MMSVLLLWKQPFCPKSNVFIFLLFDITKYSNAYTRHALHAHLSTGASKLALKTEFLH